MNSNQFHGNILELIRRTSAFLPPDVSQVIEAHRALEQAGSKADLALELVSQNIGMAKRFQRLRSARTQAPLPFTSRLPSAWTSSNWKN